MGGNSTKDSAIPRLSDYTKSPKPQEVVDALKSAEEKLLSEVEKETTKAQTIKSLETQLEDIVTLVTWDKAYDETDQKAVQSLAVKLLNVVLAEPAYSTTLLDLIKRNRQTLATICKQALSETDEQSVVGVKCLGLISPMLNKEEIADFGVIRILILAAAAPSTRPDSLAGIRRLAEGFCMEILEASGLPTLTEALRDHGNVEQQEIVLEILGIMAENKPARVELATAKYMAIFKDVVQLNTQHQSVQGGAMWLIGTLCKEQEARPFFRSNLDEVIKLSKSATADAVRRKAKSALLALSFDEENMKEIDAKHALDLALSMFNNLESVDTQQRAASLLRNISEECARQTLFKLFRKLVAHSITLMRVDNPNVYLPVLAALAKFAMRFDLQPEICNHEGIIAELIYKDGELPVRQTSNPDPLKILCLVTNNPRNNGLFQDPIYLRFLLKTQSSEIPIKRQLAKLTLAGSNSELINVEESAKVQQLSLLSRSEDDAVICKVAGTFALLALSISARAALQHFNVVEEVVKLLDHANPLVATQAAFALDTYTRGPQDMELWLKFDSTFAIDAASLHLPRFHEKIVRLHSGRGLFSNWGMVPRETDIITIVDLPRLPEWTLALWFVRPNIDKTVQMTLVEGAKTKARVYIVDGELRIQASSGSEHLLVSMKKIPKGWHHLVICRTAQGGITVYLDGARRQTLERVEIADEWRYFCNGQFGRQPFTPLCDLRLYHKQLDETDIQALYRVNINSDGGLPDSDIDVITRAGAIPLLKALLSSKIEYARTASSGMLANLATKESARRDIIRSTVLPIIINQLKSPNEASRVEVGRLLMNIA